MERLDWSKVDKTKYICQTSALVLANRTVIFPLQTIKTRLQNQDRATRQYNGMVDASRKILRNEGPTGFFKGGFQIIYNAPGTALYLCALEVVGSLLPSGVDEAYRGTVCGFAAGLACQFYFVPSDIVTQKMQVDVDSSSKWRDQVRHINRHVSHIWKTSGVRGFYKGFTVACVSHVPQSTIFWTTYGLVKQKVKRRNINNTFQVIIAAALSSITVNLTCTPFDTIKTRYQIRDDTSMVNMTKQLYATEGVRGLYKGLLTRSLIGVCSSVPMICFLEYWRRTSTIS